MRPNIRSAWAALVLASLPVVTEAQGRPSAPPRAGANARLRDTALVARDSTRLARPNRAPIATGRGDAASVLRLRQQLNLTDEQVQRLQALDAAPRTQPNDAERLRAQADLLDATRGDVNIERARAAYDRMAKVRTDAQIAQLRRRQEVRNVLTPEQRTRFDAVASRTRDRAMTAQRFGRGERGRMPMGALRGAPRGPMGRGAPLPPPARLRGDDRDDARREMMDRMRERARGRRGSER
jgi:Spy/CpxP family protein refolding chaperone